MIATLTILENGSYSPNAELLFGNKFDNLIDNYLVIHYPSKYNNYFYYMYGQCGGSRVLLPCNFVEGELRFYVTNSITRTPGKWEMIFIAAQNEIDLNTTIDINKILLSSQRFISNTFVGRVNDNNLTNPPISDIEDQNLVLYYARLDKLDQDLREAWAKGDLDGPYYIPHVDDYTSDLTWTGSREGMPEVPAINIRGKQGIQGIQGIQGPYYTPHITEGKIGFTGSQQDIPVIEDEFDLNAAVTEEVKNVMDWRWDSENQILYFYTSDYTGDKYGDSK